ncbi:glycoside hydrolase family 16 protein [Sistotremastrum suecicum HHB10207 ss-3]|nr:glycoside hydrolase family 16 protein [Sistotremastrum suecicum HHB10207 ss-3]
MEPPANEGLSSTLGRRDTARGVARGSLGGGLGPYAYHQSAAPRESTPLNSRYSAVSDLSSYEKLPQQQNVGPQNPTTATVPAYIWDTKDPDLDDSLHNPDPIRDARSDRTCDPFSLRGWMNVSALVVLVTALITLFAAYPVIHFYTSHSAPNLSTGFNLGGINASGQIPSLPGMRGLIDEDTPDTAKTRKGADGHQYNLVFSDEFETPGRTFYPGDDPYWEAVDLYYWPTVDLEWYSPSAVTTKDGKLVITMTEVPNHNLNFQSGMLQSWNKFCFTTGYIEVSVSLPGSGDTPGNWAAAWTMGNLGRAGYGASTEGTWPYSYDACDVGTFPNQTTKDNTPTAALTTGWQNPPYNGELSFLPGQRLSSCTCPGSDHPGPNVGVGRGAPEIDIIEAQVDIPLRQGQASQSYQTAPFNAAYEFVNTTPPTTIYNDAITQFNNYKGSSTQQAISAVSLLDNANYNNNSYETYGFEYWSDPNHRDQGYVTWFVGPNAMWTMTADTIGADSQTLVSQRPVSEEPMYIIMNFGMSPGFQAQDFKNLKFPSSMYIDYVRVYQRADKPVNVGCDPANYPTADYINSHLNAYTNPNLTTWAQANYTFPRNSLYDGC